MQLYRLTGYAVSNMFLMFFLLRFLPLRYSVKKSVIICTIGVCLLAVLDGLRFFCPEHVADLRYVAVTGVEILLVQGTAFWLSSYKDARTLFTGFSAFNYVIAGNVLGVIVMRYTDNVQIGWVISFVTHLILLLVLNVGMRDSYHKQQERGASGWIGLCLVPALFYISFLMLAFYPDSLFENPENIPATLSVLVTMYAEYIVVFRYTESLAWSRDIVQHNALLKTYIKGVELQSAMIAETEKNLRIMHHDMRHYVGALSVLLEQEKYQEAKTLLDTSMDTLDRHGLVTYCENMVINGVVCSLVAKAKSIGITVESSLAVPEKMKVDSMELAAVVGNLLDNAINGAGESGLKNPLVTVLARRVEQQMILEVTNPYGGTIRFDSATGLPLSSKGKEHGFGMQSVIAFADKNNASFDCFCKDRVFTARLLFVI